ncbi:Cell wall transcription factor ACE2 [Hyphodiscus hymeniophilus]|uniref:Cell wall transcription factor ACE2 n=1 Tax=Hyphodiscus hymeniophilus TaxID=353542 RepID=A0A9P6VEB2_9HELO|nr:Cell wall transcription factor ACE2 [Hyphodiscus hymeniophilus]
MSLTYENAQQFMSEANYPRMHDPQDQDEMHHEHPRYPSPPMPSGEMNGYNHQGLDVGQEDAIQNLPQLQSPSNEAASPGRSKPIPKPRREITKGDDGKYVCAWVGCTEETRSFGRKCEWSKHMDKHDRPYKCPADGCEKLPGFTYSGGLLRHEREVHGKHGGPRKQLNCPHLNCKRHTGKGFSRQENLNEHLRRVHTSEDAIADAGETEEDGEDIKIGMKRKRGSAKIGDTDIREEMKKLRAENEELKVSLSAQTAQTAEMMGQIRQLQSLVAHPHPRMPNAPMM